MVTNSLEPHPTKDGYFIDGGSGEPISKDNHTFKFKFHKFDCSNSYSIQRPYEEGDGTLELKERDSKYLRIDMIPTGSSRYSYIGSDTLIERYILLISDYNDEMCAHEYPYLKFLPHYDDHKSQQILGGFLYLEPTRLEHIKNGILNNQINDGDISFIVSGKGDVVFSSDFKINHLTEDYLQELELDVVKYKNLRCTYPYKILPNNFIDSGRTFLEPYDGTPIREFNLTFGKTVINQNIELDNEYDQDKQRILDNYQEEWMYEVFDENE